MPGDGQEQDKDEVIDRFTVDTMRDGGAFSTSVTDSHDMETITRILSVALAELDVGEADGDKWRLQVTIQRQYKRKKPTHPAPAENDQGHQLVYLECMTDSLTGSRNGWYHTTEDFDPMATEVLTTRARADEYATPCSVCFDEGESDA